MIRDSFQIKRYKKNELILSKGLSNDNKYLLILKGKISNKKQIHMKLEKDKFLKEN